jgi:hypothetical protein
MLSSAISHKNYQNVFPPNYLFVVAAVTYIQKKRELNFPGETHSNKLLKNRTNKQRPPPACYQRNAQ